MTLAEYTFYSSVGHNDTLQVCPGTATCAPAAGTLASNAANPVNDIANLTMTVDGAAMPNAFPATPANWAYSDLDLFPLDAVAMPAGTTSATITQRTTIDTLFTGSTPFDDDFRTHPLADGHHRSVEHATRGR